jgi:hypothetical protein
MRGQAEKDESGLAELDELKLEEEFKVEDLEVVAEDEAASVAGGFKHCANGTHYPG